MNKEKIKKCVCCGKSYRTLMSYYGKYNENQVCGESCAFTYKESDRYLECVKNGK